MPKRVSPVEEALATLELNGRAVHVWRCTPGRWEELALGWLAGAGELPFGAVRPEVEVRDEAGDVVVAVTLPHAVPPAPAHTANALLAAARAAPPVERAPLPSLDSMAERFRALYAAAEIYGDTGGVHAAALFDGDTMVAHAEDVGRHNAVDRAIGAALGAGHDPARLGLVLSARVSAEIALKAARAGVAWIASRSLPTTLALRVAGAAGLPVVARAGGDAAHVFEPADPARPLGVVLAGGMNRRFGGRPKALEEVGGRRIVDRAADALRDVAERVVMIANEPDVYADVDLEKRPDVRAGGGALAGVHAALSWAEELGLPGAVLVACDMPFVPPSLMAELWQRAADADGAVPESDGPRGVEPLCAAYRTTCLPAIDAALDREDLRIIAFFDDREIRRLPKDELARHGDPARMFGNVNTPEELERARSEATA